MQLEFLSVRKLLRSNGIELAIMLGVPEFVIGFTAVAFRHFDPELVTAFLSIRRGEVSISIGNVIGANIVCSSIVLPICSLINAGILPVPVSVARQDMLIYIGIISIIFIVALARKIQPMAGCGRAADLLFICDLYVSAIFKAAVARCLSIVTAYILTFSIERRYSLGVVCNPLNTRLKVLRL